MPRLCFVLAVGLVFLVSLMLGDWGGESSLAWWQKALYVLAGGAVALLLTRMLPAPTAVGAPAVTSPGASGPRPPRD